jgi:hypothetical protein
MNVVRLLSWCLIAASVLLSSPNIPVQAVATAREAFSELIRRFAHGAECS